MLIEDLLAASAIVLAVALVSGLLAFWDAETAGSDGMAAGRAGIRWGAAAVVAGLVAATLYRWLDGEWPGVGPPLFVAVAVGGAAILSLAALILRPGRRGAGTREAIALNLVWGVGFGVAIPLVLHS